jgi:short subunit dehydrogenase-like uncharacterized protein
MATKQPTQPAQAVAQPPKYPSQIVSPVDKEGRELPSVSPVVFLATLAALPIWATTVLPLAVTYQLGRKVLAPVLPKHELPPIDSGYTVDESMIKPRSERTYDLIVLGATGFTGKLAVRYLAKEYGTDGSKVKWAIAGRSLDKMNKIKKEIGEELNLDLSTITCFVVDTSLPSTMSNLVRDTRAVATTAGPYAMYGNYVVEYCSKFGTHYVDITGEVDWVKTMVLKWQETAQKTGARLISFCGHDSIPWDLSTYKMTQVMKEEFGDDLQTVKFWDECTGSAPGGTLATAFSVIEGRTFKAAKAEFNPFLKLSDGSRSKYDLQTAFPVIAKSTKSPWTSKHKRKWVVPFVMAPVNGAVVQWTHALQQEGNPMLTYSETQVFNDFMTAVVSYLGLIIFTGLMFNPITAYFLKHYALPKSGEGPSMKNMTEKPFSCIYGEGIGAQGKRVESIMYFDKDLGCLETSRMLVESGLTLAMSEDKLSSSAGGFYSPAAGMGDVLLDRITQTGTYFQCRPVTDSKVQKKSE